MSRFGYGPVYVVAGHNNARSNVAYLSVTFSLSCGIVRSSHSRSDGDLLEGLHDVFGR